MELEASILEEMSETNTPGATVAVVKGDEASRVTSHQLLTHTVGLRDEASHVARWCLVCSAGYRIYHASGGAGYAFEGI